MKYLLRILFVLTLGYGAASKAQSFGGGDVVLNANIGSPHLFKTAVKLAVKRPAFNDNFDGRLEVSPIKGMNPVAVKAEYGINNFFGLGLNFSFWSIRFDVTDHYNFQNKNIGTFYSDSVDVYSFKVSSKSFGIRPNLHFPIKSAKNDLYLGLGLGVTTNKLKIGFNSTDAGRVAKNFNKGLSQELALPGSLYIAPSVGYRAYLSPVFGLNFEVGYEKGAVLQCGLVVKMNGE